MFLKHFFLLILFTFNIGATFASDIEHQDLSTPHCEEFSHQDINNDQKKTETDNSDHCSNHSCCHTHVHHFISSTVAFYIEMSFTDYTFLEPFQSKAVTFIEIIKPPLV